MPQHTVEIPQHEKMYVCLNIALKALTLSNFKRQYALKEKYI